jgi:alcohol dehydrogenase, propanol-preferring
VRAMVLDRAREPLTERELPDPVPEPGQVLIDVAACAVCRTDLHIVDGELTEPKLPLVPGHMIVGRVAAQGEGAKRFAVGDRVGVPWLGWVDETCRYCRMDRENLCVQGKFTGYDFDGGYAERTVADERFCFPIPDSYTDEHAAPLLCSGLIGYRSLRLAGEGERLGMYGFGSSAHLIIQVAVHRGWSVYALTRRGTSRIRRRPALWEPIGPAPWATPRRGTWTRPSSSRPSVSWSPTRWPPWRRAGPWSAPEST